MLNLHFINVHLKIDLFVIPVIVFILSSVLLPIFPSVAVAEIYTYKDKNGVRCFTNVPNKMQNGPKYKIFIPEHTGREYYKRDGGVPIYINSFSRAKNIAAFDPIIEKASVTYGLDCALIKAVISAESAFNSQAVSPKGAKGLMQIMPENYSSLNISDPFHPYQNIMGGSKYLRQMLEVNNKNLKLALASYNAGPQAVKKYEGIPPYNETINYVAKVIDLYRQYKSM